MTAAQASLNAVSKTVSKRLLGDEILRRATRAVPEEFA